MLYDTILYSPTMHYVTVLLYYYPTVLLYCFTMLCYAILLEPLNLTREP